MGGKAVGGTTVGGATVKDAAMGCTAVGDAGAGGVTVSVGGVEACAANLGFNIQIATLSKSTLIALTKPISQTERPGMADTPAASVKLGITA
jgi:hypothetical protein